MNGEEAVAVFAEAELRATKECMEFPEKYFWNLPEMGGDHVEFGQ